MTSASSSNVGAIWAGTPGADANVDGPMCEHRSWSCLRGLLADGGADQIDLIGHCTRWFGRRDPGHDRAEVGSPDPGGVLGDNRDAQPHALRLCSFVRRRRCGGGCNRHCSQRCRCRQQCRRPCTHGSLRYRGSAQRRKHPVGDASQGHRLPVGNCLAVTGGDTEDGGCPESAGSPHAVASTMGW